MKKIKLPKIIGHRGACGLAPENTMSSLIKASLLKLSFVEIDVKISKDSIPILLHDDDLSRTTNGNGLCCKYDFDKLSMLDAGKWYSKEFENERILSLSKCLDFLFEKKISVNIELKPNKGKEFENVKSIGDLLKSKKNLPNFFFTTFDLYSLDLVSAILPLVPIGFLIEDSSFYGKENVIDICKQYDCFSVGLKSSMVNKETVDFFKKHNLTITTFTVNSVDQAYDFFSLGVDSIFSDRPDLLNI